MTAAEHDAAATPLSRLLGEVRRRWHEGSPTDSRRLFHGRGQCYEGLGFINVDWFAPVVLIICYDDEVDLWLEELLLGLRELLGQALSCVVVQRRQRRGAPSEVVLGTLPAEPRAREAALSYRLSLGRGADAGTGQTCFEPLRLYLLILGGGAVCWCRFCRQSGHEPKSARNR